MGLPILRCPSCHDGRLDVEASPAVCAVCGRSYVQIDGVLNLLLPQARAAVEVGMRERPHWYLDDQVRYADEGPYRHHTRQRERYILDLLTRHLPGGAGRIAIDIGCGDGIVTRYLGRIPGLVVVGVDYNHLRLARARTLVPSAHLVAADLTSGDLFHEGVADLVVLHHVIEHLHDPVGACRQAARYLKAGGLLLVGVPNEGTWWWWFRNHIVQRRSFATTDHVQFFTLASLSHTLLEAGLEVVETKRMGGGLPYSRIDSALHSFERIDWALDRLGRILPFLATSLYALGRRPT